MRNHSCPPRFSDCPWGCPQTWGPALDSTEATPTCCSLRIPTPAPSATGCVGWCFPRRPAALGPARGACSCAPPPTPSAPDAWPQPQRRFSSFSHPTCKYCRTSTPAPLSLRAPVVVCLLCRSSQSVRFDPGRLKKKKHRKAKLPGGGSGSGSRGCGSSGGAGGGGGGGGGTGDGGGDGPPRPGNWKEMTRRQRKHHKQRGGRARPGP